MLNRKQHEAAFEVARGDLSLVKISEKLNISPWTLGRWRNLPEFKVEVERLLNLWAEDIEKKGIADRRRRLFQTDRRWRRKQSLIEQRAKAFREMAKIDPELAAVPGGNTGMLALTVKYLHVGENEYQRVIEAEFDAALDAAMRADEEHAATELGQWKQKRELTGPNGGPLEIKVTFVDAPSSAPDALPPTQSS